MSSESRDESKPSVINLAAMTQFASAGIVSKSIHSDKQIRLVLFAFDRGQLLSEHTAAVPAILHILEGRAELTLDDETIEAEPGTLVHIPAHLPHSVRARDKVVMLLSLLRS
jgi:quercetin dioxygenase-like cupin family protein